MAPTIGPIQYAICPSKMCVTTTGPKVHGGIAISGAAQRSRHHHGESQSVGERDVDDGRLLGQQRTGDDRTAADEHEREGADELSREVAPGIFHCGMGTESMSVRGAAS